VPDPSAFLETVIVPNMTNPQTTRLANPRRTTLASVRSAEELLAQRAARRAEQVAQAGHAEHASS
jgi:hypothetical protein